MSHNRILQNERLTGNGVRRNGHARRQSRISPGLCVSVDGADHALEPDDLLDNESISELHNWLNATEGTVSFTINNLLAWSDEARWELFTMIAGLDCPPEIQLSRQNATFTDLFAAVLHAVEGGNDVVRCNRGRKAAIEAAALVHPDALDIACSQIAEQFKVLGIRGVHPQTLLKQAREIAGQNSPAVENDTQMCAKLYLDHLRRRHDCEDELPVNYFHDSFWVWDGKIWRGVADEQFKARVVEYLQNVPGLENFGTKFLNDVIMHLKGLTFLDLESNSPPVWINCRSPMDISPPYLVFENQMVNERTLLDAEYVEEIEFCDFDPKNFSCVKLPFEFDPERECPLWQQTLNEIFPKTGVNDRRISVLREFMGWTLIRGDVSFQKFLVLVGEGGNGKSTILRVWEALLGSENVSHVPLEHLNGEFRVVEMNGKLANIAGDMGYVDKVAEGRLKELTGGDPIQANRKFKTPITMVPTARMIFATNALPPINDRSDGIWRRLIAIPLFRQFAEQDQDRHRVDRLLQELPGIFNWASIGAMRLFRQGGFSDCAVCRYCAEEHRYQTDPFRQWLEERAILDYGVRVPANAAYADYREFCETNGRKPKNSSEFGKHVLKASAVSKQRLGPRGVREWNYVGLGLIDNPKTREHPSNSKARKHPSRRRSSYYR